MEGRRRGIIDGTVQNLNGGTEDNHESEPCLSLGMDVYMS
jgi:hypothetical protein